MKYTTPNFEVEVVETSDVIAVSVVEKITTNGQEVGYVQSNEEKGTMDVVIPEVGKFFI